MTELERTVVDRGQRRPGRGGRVRAVRARPRSAPRPARSSARVGYAESELLAAADLRRQPARSRRVIGCAAPGSRFVDDLPGHRHDARRGLRLRLPERRADRGVGRGAGAGRRHADRRARRRTASRPSRSPRRRRPRPRSSSRRSRGRRRRRGQPATPSLVQYTGVKWCERRGLRLQLGERRARVRSTTTGVVPGFKQALEGQTVGSQMLVVIPPALPATARAGSSEHELVGRDARLRRRHPRDAAPASAAQPQPLAGSDPRPSGPGRFRVLARLTGCAAFSFWGPPGRSAHRRWR